MLLSSDILSLFMEKHDDAQTDINFAKCIYLKVDFTDFSNEMYRYQNY